MKRLTTDTPKSNLHTALNLFYAKDGQAWVRGGGSAPEYEDATLNDYIRKAIKQVATCPPMFDELDDEKLAEVMADWCMDEIESHEGIIGMLYTAGWVCAELRARLKMYEDTGLTPDQVAERLKSVYTAEQIEETQNEAYDLGVEAVLHDCFGLTWSDAAELRKEIKKIKAARKWTQVAEGLPEQDKVEKYYGQYGEHPQYIVMIAHAVRPTVLAFDGEGFYDPVTNEPYKVTHWMELPPAPEVEK